MFKIFGNRFLKDTAGEADNRFFEPIKVTIVAFEDGRSENCGLFLQQVLARYDFLAVNFYDEKTDKTFLNLQGKNFFDCFDTGKQILKKTKADVLIWGLRQADKIRLNFQIAKQYEADDLLTVSLLDGLYLPFAYFEQKKLPEVMAELLAAIILMVGGERPEILKKLTEDIGRKGTPQGLSVAYMPYVLNMLALVYLHAKRDVLQLKDVNLISSMLENAHNAASGIKDGLLTGSIYAHFGQLYQYAAEMFAKHKYTFYRNAAECCRRAQKYFNRYSYPYDFGILSYRLSKLYFGYWKQVSDIQALRDAVFHLREAEKIFTNATFPYFWAKIEGDLGFYLSMLGLFSHSDEISMLAVENYKKRQKVYTKDLWPLKWAKAQEDIGNIFYNSGKQLNDEEYLEEAIKYYEEAAEIYENHKLSAELKQMQVCIAKCDEHIKRIAKQIMLA